MKRLIAREISTPPTFAMLLPRRSLAAFCLALALGGGARADALPEGVEQQRAFGLFSLLRSQDDLCFDFPNDGCYARCHLMTLRLRQMGVDVKRAWAFSAGVRLHAKTPKGVVEWDFHVAPLVPVRAGDRVDWLVFDPTLMSRPVPLEDWGRAMRKSDAAPMPQLTTTSLGEPPIRNGKRLAGSGYWTSSDPREGPTVHATNTLRGYKASRPRK